MHPKAPWAHLPAQGTPEALGARLRVLASNASGGRHHQRQQPASCCPAGLDGGQTIEPDYKPQLECFLREAEQGACARKGKSKTQPRQCGVQMVMAFAEHSQECRCPLSCAQHKCAHLQSPAPHQARLPCLPQAQHWQNPATWMTLIRSEAQQLRGPCHWVRVYTDGAGPPCTAPNGICRLSGYLCSCLAAHLHPPSTRRQ